MKYRIYLKSVILIALFHFHQGAVGQEVVNLELSITKSPTSLTSALRQLQDSHPIRFYYKPEWIHGISLEEKLSGYKLGAVLDSVLQGTDITYYMMDPYNMVFVKDPTKGIARRTYLSKSYAENKRIESIRIGRKGMSRTNNRNVIRGEIVDGDSKRPIEGVAILVVGTSKGTTTNEFGRFEIMMESGYSVLAIRSIGYEELVIDMEVYNDGFVNFELEDEAILLNEVIITNKIAEDIVDTQMGVTRIDINDLEKSSNLLGQSDLIKQLQIYSGVNTVSPAAAGFNVRGGSADQNLVLYDGMPVFNTSHAFGFFSSFNPSAIRDANFYKSSLEADYGGRISSVLDVRTLDGDLKKTSLSGGIGLAAANIMLSGPVFRDKTTFLISSRFTYSDWLINAVQSNYVDLSRVGVSFNDWSAKVSHHLNKTSKLTLSGYVSGDKFKFKEDTTYANQSKLLSLTFDKQISASLASVVKLGMGSYSYDLSSSTYQYRLSYDIKYPSLDAKLLVYGDKHQLSAGYQSILYNFNPGQLTPLSNKSVFKPVQLPQKRALEMALFVNDEFKLSKKLSLNAGIRVPFFAGIGPEVLNRYADGLPISKFSTTDTLSYKKGELTHIYKNVEPRVSLRYLLTKELSLKFSYNRINQFLNLVTNTTAITPFDIWQPSNLYFQPQRGDQWAFGIYKNLSKAVNISIESYYKHIDNVVDFKNGAELVLNRALETELIQGISNSYGIEFSVLKNEGRLKGLINYTYARSFRQFPVVPGGETINEGELFPSNFDQPNAININVKYAFSRRYSVTSNFSYRTGRPFTIPVSYYEIENTPVVNFGNRNKLRMPDDHHLDVSFTIDGGHKRKRIGEGMWTFSLYNVYGRRNPYSIFYKTDSKGFIKSYKLSVIGTIIPGITYSFRL